MVHRYVVANLVLIGCSLFLVESFSVRPSLSSSARRSFNAITKPHYQLQRRRVYSNVNEDHEQGGRQGRGWRYVQVRNDD